MLLPTPLFPGCKKHEPVTVAIRTINGKRGPDVNLSAGDIPIAPGSESSVQDEIKGIHGVLGSTGSFKKIEDYLYEADCPLPNTELAEEHFRARFGKDAPQGAAGFAACSVLNHEGLIGRAYDWKYDDAVTFVVHTPANGDRFASVSICSSPAGITKESVETHTVPASLWAILPFYAVDGMNENGVTCSVCVVHGKGSEDILWHGKEFCAVGAVRHVLDHARTAEEGADIIAAEAWMPAATKLGGYSLHFMVTDETHTFIVEDGVVIDITDDDIKAMTNFRLGSRSFLDETGHADVDTIASYDPYGTGVERYNELVDYAKSPTSEETGMREWFTGFVYSDAYRESLLTRSTTRPSDFAGTEISRDHFAKVNETEAIKAWFKSAKVHEKWIARERDGKFWQTVHSAVYDVTARTVSVVVQEGTAVHDFPIVREGSGSGTVKSVNDVEPDSRTGNVELTAQDIPYGGEGASNVETAIELNRQAAVDNAEAIDSVEQQLGELKDDTYTKSEVDDKINQSAAHYLTKRTGTEGHYSYPQFATHADLAAAKAAHTEANPQFFYGTEGHTPDKNDYCIVLADETHSGATTRYMFVGEWDNNGYFRYQYTINETALTEKQWAAINSLTSVDEDGNLCFDGIPFLNSSGELLFTEDDPIFTAWKNEVQIILGNGANIASGKYKQIAIGAHATANGQNAIALGSSEPGGKTNGPRAMAQNSIAIGAGANATATNAVQILAGTNNKSGTIQLGNKVVAFLSDIPISQADIDDYRYYKGHWDMSVTYKTGDIVRAERTVEGQTEKEVTYFKSLRDSNRANNPFTTPTYWSVTTDDEGLEKLTLFVKAAIAGMTGADIPVSPTNADKIDVALGNKLSISDIAQHQFPPESHSHESTEIKVKNGENMFPLVVTPSSSAKTGQAADAYETGVKFENLQAKAFVKTDDTFEWSNVTATIFAKDEEVSDFYVRIDAIISEGRVKNSEIGKFFARGEKLISGCYFDFEYETIRLFDANGDYTSGGSSKLDFVQKSLSEVVKTADGLTPSAKAALLADDAFKQAVADKLDKASVVPPSSTATTGQAADAKATGEALNGKARIARVGDVGSLERLDFYLEIRNDGFYLVNNGVSIDQFVKIPFSDIVGTLALVSQLSGITSQDITDFLHYKGEVKETPSLDDYEVGDIVYAARGYIVLPEVSGYFKRDDSAEYGWVRLYAEDVDNGFTKLIDLFGESNSQLAKTIEDKAVIFLRYSGGFIYKEEVADANKITKFSDLAKIVQTGRAVLQATATSASGSSPVLFRPHMINDGTGAQAANILFDATGTIDEGIYTRCIRATKKAGTEDELMVQGTNQRERLAKYNDLAYALNDDGTIKDRAVNKLTWTAESESHSFSLDTNLPAPVDGVGRDFLVQIHTDAAVDITSALALKGDLPSITEAGDYILAFTELHDNMWLVKKLTLEDAQ